MSSGRIRDVFYSLVSFFLGAVFLLFAFLEFYDIDFAFSSWIWDAVFMIGFALFFFGAGFYGLWSVMKGRSTEEVQPGERREMIKIAVAIVAFLVAVWVMFHFGVR